MNQLRKELYEFIKTLGLQQEIKSRFGKSYTQVSNNELEQVVNKVKAGMECTTRPSNLTGAFVELVNILQQKHILLKSEANKVLQTI